MKLKFNFSIGKLFQNKRFSVIFSLVVAFVFWMVISINQTPTIERTIVNVPVTINTQGTTAGDRGLDVVDSNFQKLVSVKVMGPAYVVGSLTAEDIMVSPSLAGVTEPGEYELLLYATKGSFASEYSVSSITPAVLKLNFDYIDTKEFTVQPEVVGVSAVQGLVAETPIISNADEITVTVKGARAYMEKLATVKAYAEVNTVLSETTTYQADILLYDKDGNKLDISNFTISKSKVSVSVPVSKTKVVPILPIFKNAPSEYQNFLKYSLSNTEVTIIGPAATVDAISGIELSPLDFNEISISNNSFELVPVLPDGIKLLDNVQAVTVQIDTKSFAEKTFTVSEYLVVNNQSGYKVSLNSSIKNVKVCGPRRVLNSISANDLVAVIDLTGKTMGDFTVNVTITCPANNSVWQIGTYQASIKVK